MRKVTSGCRIPQLAGERGGAPPHRCFYATPPPTFHPLLKPFHPLHC